MRKLDVDVLECCGVHKCVWPAINRGLLLDVERPSGYEDFYYFYPGARRIVIRELDMKFTIISSKRK